MKVPNLILVPLTDEYREYPTPLIRYCLFFKSAQKRLGKTII